MFLDSKEEYLQRMDTLFDRVRNCEKAAGVSQIFIPGETEDLKQRAQLEQGIPFTNGEIEALHELATELGSGVRLS
jgi:LDH2 family malate/lactate/ureidoglycolate dehydrogenase